MRVKKIIHSLALVAIGWMMGYFSQDQAQPQQVASACSCYLGAEKPLVTQERLIVSDPIGPIEESFLEEPDTEEVTSVTESEESDTYEPISIESSLGPIGESNDSSSTSEISEVLNPSPTSVEEATPNTLVPDRPPTETPVAAGGGFNNGTLRVTISRF